MPLEDLENGSRSFEGEPAADALEAGTAQIWHRMNTSLVGDTVQIGFTLSDDQMRSLDTSDASFAITGATATYPAVLTVTPLSITIAFSPDQLILIEDVLGMTQLNGNYFNVISSTFNTVT